MLLILKRSFAALTDRRIYGLVFLSGILTILAFILFAGGVTFALSMITFAEDGWIDTAINWLGGTAAVIIGWFLIPMIFPLITLLFLDKIVIYIGEKYYPDICTSFSPSLREILPAAIGFIFRAIFLNILALPFYLIPVINIVVYYLLNGYLLGREYFEMIAFRYKSVKDAKTLRKKYKWKIITGGVIITLLFTFPILNLFAPIMATVFMMHLYHGILRGER